ncbi:hypothetical protein FIU87_05495 [Bacillus sp. THAF10]|nr:hypothetical protein FIU87_05495 [Bacillus sp. THAF10]
MGYRNSRKFVTGLKTSSTVLSHEEQLQVNTFIGEAIITNSIRQNAEKKLTNRRLQKLTKRLQRQYKNKI